MKSPLLVGIHGRARSGKDETFLAIQKWAAGEELSALRGAFADRMKLSMVRAFFPQCDMEFALAFCERMKLDEAEVQIFFPGGDLVSIGSRSYHVNYGNSGHRDLLDINIWVDQLLPDTKTRREMTSPFYPDWHENFTQDGFLADVAVVTDVRMENEAERVIKLGGKIVKINRNVEQMSHTSEQPLHENLIDYHLDNNGSIEDLQDRVADLMNEITSRGDR